MKSKSKIAQAFRYALLRRHQFSRQISTRHNSCNSWEQNSKNNEKVHFHQGIRTVPGVPKRTKYIFLFFFRLIKEQGQKKGQITNNVTTSLRESQKILLSDRHNAQRYSHFGKGPCMYYVITKKEGEGAQKMNFFDYVQYKQRGAGQKTQNLDYVIHEWSLMVSVISIVFLIITKK